MAIRHEPIALAFAALGLAAHQQGSTQGAWLCGFVALLLFCLSLVTARALPQKSGVSHAAQKPRLVLSDLRIYPVKSCAGVSVRERSLDRFGLCDDRRLMVVSAEPSPTSGAHAFVTQRQLPRMALISCEGVGEGSGPPKRLVAPDVPPLELGGDGALRRRSALRVRVWDEDELFADDLGDEAASWMCRVLDAPVRLVTCRASWRRPLDARYVPRPRCSWGGPQVGFADGFPFLLLTTSSLADLNRRLVEQHPASAELPLPYTRFRPNLVVDSAGLPPFAEDRWKRVRIGGVTFRVVKGCSRCKITTIHPETAVEGALVGADGATPEPLATLLSYREFGAKGNYYFGQNLVHEWSPWHRRLAERASRWWSGGGDDGFNLLRVGDTVEVLEEGEPVWDSSSVAAE